MVANDVPVGPRSQFCRGDMVLRMLEEFDVNEEELRGDVGRLVEELLASRLLVDAAPAAE